MTQQDLGGTPIRLIAPGALALDADFPPLSMALFEVLLRRRSCREIAPGELPLYLLSRLMWAAFGINRPKESGRTASSSSDGESISIYVALMGGLYRYVAHSHLLCPVLTQDIRSATGVLDHVASSPVCLIYAARIDRAPGVARFERQFHAALDTGAISQNVFLFCAAEGLATATCSQVDRVALARRMQLAPGNDVILTQSLGYPVPGTAATPEYMMGTAYAAR